MKTFVPSALALMAAVSIALPASAASPPTQFVGSFQTTYNTADPGLVVDASPSMGSLSFSLAQGGSTSVDLFDLYTTESTVNVGEDTTPKPISVNFSFSEPTPGFGGSVTGTTQGDSLISGLIQNGSVTWSNNGNEVLDFGDGGVLDVHLNNATFDAGIAGLHGGETAGAEISGTFKLVRAATVSAAPEPSSWALMVGGIALLGGLLRAVRTRRRECEAFMRVSI